MGRQKASSHYSTSETVSDGSAIVVTRSSLTYAAVTSDVQANTEEHQGSPGTETKYHQGTIQSSPSDTFRRRSKNEKLCGFVIPPVSGTLSFQEKKKILLIDDTNSRPRFHLYSSSTVIPYPLLCLPSPPTSLRCPSYTSKPFFFLLSREFSAARIRTSQSCQSKDSSFIRQHGVSALIPSFPRSSQSSFLFLFFSNIQFSPYSIIPTFNPALTASLKHSLKVL